MKWIALFVVILCLAALLCWRPIAWQLVNAEIRHKFPTVRGIQTGQLAAWLDDPKRPPPLLLDVREPAEYEVSDIAEARRVEPGSDPGVLHVPKDQPIVTYCSVGYRSAAFARRLQDAGFTNVRNLQGSIFQWANEGHPVFKDGRRVEAVHPFNKTWGLLLNPSLRADVPPPPGKSG